ncbi:MAG: SDR family NAD(P)-dependent oxidoreductase [Clostridia bacterium]|nr:SDR family NAD(P)-dependent oxidoreductase [Clostridia bacterium]
MSGVAVITGGSSGIGLATARLFSQKGWTVYELSRKGTGEAGITHITADVCDEEGLRSAFEQIAAKEGKIDVLVNNAGFGISGAIEYTKISQAQKQMDVNFFGALRSTVAALPYIRKSDEGHIIFVSSMGAPLALPFQAFYSCSKAAINDLTLALANELRPFKIAVCAVMPGDVKTGFTAARQKDETGDGVYGSVIKKSVATMEKDEQSGMSPQKIAAHIYKLSRKKHPKPLSTVGFTYKLIAVVQKLLPTRLVNYIVGKLYS